MASPPLVAPSSPTSLARELDLFKIENDVIAALQAANRGDLNPRPISVLSMPLPCTRLTESATKYALQLVDPLIFTHCIRTYYFGTAIASVNFPELGWNPETFYLASILHDIGCSHKAFRETQMSLEMHGGMLARSFLLDEGASREVADIVMEAICRHKDTQGGSWGHSPESQMLMFGAQLDVLGNYAGLIHRETINDVVQKYPRHDFNNVFADLIVEEVVVKRHCTGVSAIKQGVISIVRRNPVFSH